MWEAWGGGEGVSGTGKALECTGSGRQESEWERKGRRMECGSEGEALEEGEGEGEEE